MPSPKEFTLGKSPNDTPVSILGAGPAGASAAIAARSEGSAVHLIDGAKFPRHKVCGEFFSPEIAAELEHLGAWEAFLESGPARVQRMKLHFGRREKVARLPEHAWGLSRYTFDALLRDRAQTLGVELLREPAREAGDDAPTVIASGRHCSVKPGPRTGARLFGFKAHFDGPADDAVELFFFGRCYVGVNAIENGRTNVCGLGPEDFLGEYQFDYDRVVGQCPALAARLAPLTRSTKWFSTGPLDYFQSFGARSSGPSSDRSPAARGARYLAGDALSFVDPFTGSGLLTAVKTGAMAGTAAARSAPVETYHHACRASLKRPFEIASIFRSAVERGWLNDHWTAWLAAMIPSRVLFGLTRPRR